MDSGWLALVQSVAGMVGAAEALIPRHPFGGFHVETQAIPTFVLGAAFGASGWVLVDALAERRATARANGVADAAGVASGTTGASAWRRATALPLRLGILLLGFVLASAVLDYAQDVATMAAFAPPSDLDLAVRLIDVFAVLAVAGAVLAIPAPRAAAVAFAAAAVLGGALALANLWQSPLGLDRTALLMAFVAPWQDVLGWAALAAALAFLAAVADRRGTGRSFVAGGARRSASPLVRSAGRDRARSSRPRPPSGHPADLTKSRRD